MRFVMPDDEINASPPFDNPDADLIVRSSDGVNFRVLKTILAEASPIFKTIFTLPRPDNNNDSAVIAVVDLSESSTVLDHLLRFCYPCASPRLNSLKEIVDVLLVARKYEIEALAEYVRLAIIPFLDSDLVGVYAVACILDSEEMARRAARQALSIPRDVLFNADNSMLECISGAAYQSLLVYHRKASSAAASYVRNTNHGWLPESVATSSIHNSRIGYYIASPMFVRYREQAASTLDNHPWGAAICNSHRLWPLVRDSTVDGRHRFGEYWALQTYADLLAAKVDEEAEKVRKGPILSYV
jgi:hypothetical protein